MVSFYFLGMLVLFKPNTGQQYSHGMIPSELQGYGLLLFARLHQWALLVVTAFASLPLQSPNKLCQLRHYRYRGIKKLSVTSLPHLRLKGTQA
jgi:hypothetical protein